MIKHFIQEAFALKDKKHYKHALEVFYKVLEYDNSSVEILVEIAELYYLMNNEERALSYIEQVLELNPIHRLGLKMLQKIFESKLAYDKAEQIAKNIYSISNEPDDLVEIFRLLHLQKKYSEISEYKITTYTSQIYLEQARAFFQQDLHDKAITLLEKALLFDTNNQDALLLLAEIKYYQDNKEECLQIVEKLKINTTNADLMFFLAKIEQFKQNFEKAINHLNCAIKKNNSNSLYYYQLGNIYYKTGKNDLAQKNYNIAISLEPKNAQYHFALANLYYIQKHYKRALEELKNNSFEARLLKAIILYDTGYLALAKKELNKLENEQPENKIVEEYRAKIKDELKIN